MSEIDLKEIHNQVFSAIIGVRGDIAVAMMAEAIAHVLQTSGIQSGTPDYQNFEAVWQEMLIGSLVCLEYQRLGNSTH